MTNTLTKDSRSGWPGYRLRGPSPRGDNVGILLIPSTLWRLDLDGPSFDSDTTLFPRSMCRFPRLVPYLNALIHTVVERKPDQYLNNNITITLYIQYQYFKILELLPAHRRSQLPIENQFFTQFFSKMCLPRSKIKFFALWQSVRDGSISFSDAIASLPRQDLRIAETKAREMLALQEKVSGKEHPLKSHQTVQTCELKMER